MRQRMLRAEWILGLGRAKGRPCKGCSQPKGSWASQSTTLKRLLRIYPFSAPAQEELLPQAYLLDFPSATYSNWNRILDITIQLNLFREIYHAQKQNAQLVFISLIISREAHNIIFYYFIVKQFLRKGFK